MKALRAEIENEAMFGIAGPVTWPTAVVAWQSVAGANVGAKTLTRYQASLRMMRPFLDRLAVQAVTADVLRAMIRDRKRQAVSNATIRRDLTALSSVLNHAIDEGWIETNAATAINRGRAAPERHVPIVLPQEAGIAAMRAALPLRWRDLVDFARKTGLRADELVTLRRDAINRDARSLTIRGKGNRVRTVPLDRHDIALLDRQPPYIGSPLVFWEDAGEPISNLSSRWGGYRRRVAQKAAQSKRPFTGFRFHDLRHLFAVEFLRDGRGSIYDLQRILGHASIKTTERYLDFLTPEQAAAAMDGVAQKAAHEPRSGSNK